MIYSGAHARCSHCTARNAAVAAAGGGGGVISPPPPPLLTIFRHAEASVGLESVGDYQLCLAQEAHSTGRCLNMSGW